MSTIGVSVTALSSCASLTRNNREDERFVLGEVYLENERRQPASVVLVIERDGTELYRDTISLKARQGNTIHQKTIEQFRCESGVFRFSVKHADDDTWTEFSTRDWSSGGVFVSVRPSGAFQYGHSFGVEAECDRTGGGSS